MYALFSSINAYAFLNHIVVYVMPGEGIDVETPMSVPEAEKKRVPSVIQTARVREDPMPGFGVTLPEARTMVTYLALTGVACSVASCDARVASGESETAQDDAPHTAHPPC